jgi:DNA gyrase subunit A
MIKKSLVTELPGPSSQTFVLVRVNEGDRLIEVGLTDNKTKDILLFTAQGMAIRFKEEEVRPMGLVAAGVNGMKLSDGDEVVGMAVLPAEGEIFIVTSDGRAKRLEQKEFPIQGRYGKGVIAWDISDKIRLAGAVLDKPNYMVTIHLSKGAPKSTRLDAAALRKRASTKGDLVVEVKPGEEVVSVNTAWTVEKYVAAPNGRSNGHKPQGEGKKNASVNASASGKARAASPQKKSAPAKKAPVKKTKAPSKMSKATPKAKPANKVPVKGKKVKARK